MMETVQMFMQYNLPMVRLRLWDVLDIAILSFVIYKLLWMLRKTSSGRVLRGILMLMLAMGFSSATKLTATSFLLNKVVEWGILVLVILFQPELRRFLERVGSSRLGLVFTSSKASPRDLEAAITETTAAYTDMSRDKVGALMVFERQNLLDDVIKTGTALDCAVSSELLKNIFWNKAPLHDGAVIVRDGRIVGAGCMLPLSGNVNLSRDLGMRHRAGIGMSEHSDAVVVIVSEETGSISAAVGGMLKRHLAPETLERLLRNELLSDSQEEKKPGQNQLVNLILGWNRKDGDRT
ncbi:diadenylate cyclase CdaA [Pseudoflavonifractor phocaeensis]|uniref:diadenylate cyclase CdaA n=1 Tax=Pseudoflavonifractor phocaeensis TaxID=1870988 RepID=UPI001F313693|nr:diadenylate cyclase CdaA [Pseudoflavonifractor phocaeensis]MCF2596418.1 TIGR00159 family protein [Pseudoflavonifractor phocaeensis]MDY3905495.1 diadenylate cyclase CdaA [Lawsonibacter sp.]